MSLTYLEGPETEPVSLDEMKLWLKLTSSEEDSLLSSLIKFARETIELRTRHILIFQKWALRLPYSYLKEKIKLPLRPLNLIESVQQIEKEGEEIHSIDLPFTIQLEPPESLLISKKTPSSFFLKNQTSFEVILRVGYGALPNDIPESLRHVMRLLITYGYENRGDKEAMQTYVSSSDVFDFLQPYRHMRLI